MVNSKQKQFSETRGALTTGHANDARTTAFIFKTLYVTAGKTIFRIHLEIEGTRR